MKKGKYIDIYVIMACMSHKKPNSNFKKIDQMLEKACKNCEEPIDENISNEPELVFDEPDSKIIYHH